MVSFPVRLLPLVVAALIVLAGCGGSDSEAGKFNVLFVTLDTVRADRIGCYGHEGAETPVLDALAERGVLFEQAFTPVPITLPSHATMMTGLFPAEHGVRINEDLTFSDEAATLAEIYGRNGFETAAFIGAIVLESSFGLARGFDVYDEKMSLAPEGSLDRRAFERPANEVVDTALDWFSGRKAKPFFCWVHFYDPHLTYEPPPPYDRRFSHDPYDGEIAFTDSQVGRLLEYLENEGSLERTIVVVAGDHGEGLGEHEERDHAVFIYNTTVHVPLIFSLPGVVAEGKRVQAMVGLADIFPTLLEFSGFEPQPGITGRSLTAALRGEDLESADQYSESDYPYDAFNWSPLRAITTPRWKYIRAPRPELYDRAEDGGELNNLAAEHESLVRELQARLAAMEASMKPRKAREGSMTPEQLQRLAALGYTTSGVEKSAPVDYTALDDPKDRVDILNQWLEALEHLQQQRIPEGIEVLKDLAAKDPGYSQLHFELGHALEVTGRREEAVEHFKTGFEVQKAEGRIKHSPSLARLHNRCGMLLVELGRGVEAIGHFEESLAIVPGDKQVVNNLGSAYARMGRFEEAIPQYREALRIAPDDPEARANLGRAMARLGVGKLVAGEYGEGISLLSEGLGYNPEDINAADALARILAACPEAEHRDPAEAVRRAERVCMASQRGHPLHLDTLAIAYASAGRFEEAVAAAKEALAIAVNAKQEQLAADIRKRINLFEVQQTYRGFP